jgi:hypothetical protein
MENIERITSRTILELVKEVKEMHQNRAMRLSKDTFVRRLLRPPYTLTKRMLNRLGFNVKYTGRSDMYYFSHDERRWHVNFLAYCLENWDSLAFDLTVFPYEDRKEIVKFVRNKLIGALYNVIESDELFDPEDLMYEREYAKMKGRISKKGGYYCLRWGKKYYLPVDHFEPVVFYHKYGTSAIPDHGKIAGKDIIDAGAFIGDSALVLNELSPKRIWAFEPEEKNYSLLERTVKINTLTNVIPIRMALSSH